MHQRISEAGVTGNANRSKLILRHGSASHDLVRIVPDETTLLWRIDWPDIGLSDAVNITRAKEAARLWAESQMLRTLRKNGAERALKSLSNFSWFCSPVRQKRAA
jgi:hypothetical protein